MGPPPCSCILGNRHETLPAIWDADFLYGPKNAAGDAFVLCEINVARCSHSRTRRCSRSQRRRYAPCNEKKEGTDLIGHLCLLASCSLNLELDDRPAGDLAAAQVYGRPR